MQPLQPSAVRHDLQAPFDDAARKTKAGYSHVALEASISSLSWPSNDRPAKNVTLARILSAMPVGTKATSSAVSVPPVGSLQSRSTHARSHGLTRAVIALNPRLELRSDVDA